jgi:hypothetical protein
MGEALGELLPFALGTALSPLPIVAVILMLFTPRARSNGVLFVIGWYCGIVVVGAIALASGGVATDDGSSSTTTAWIEVLLGAVLLGLAGRQWRGRPKAGEPGETPAWMSGLDSFSGARSFTVAAALSGVNPKNLVLTIGAATTIASMGLSTGQEAGTLLIYAALASVTVAAPVVYYLIRGERAQAKLDEMKAWLAQHNAAVMAVILLIFGVKLIGDGLTILST